MLNTPVPISAIPADTSTPVATIAITPSPTSPSHNKCVEIQSANVDELNLSGTMVLTDMYYKAYLINSNTFEKTELTKIGVLSQHGWTIKDC